MSWAVGREASRLEGKEYSLPRIFDINMPLMYGEGIEKGMKRFRDKTDEAFKGKS